MNSQDIQVLLADHDAAVLESLSQWLQNAGYKVRATSHGQEALEWAESDPPDILIADWQTPELSGLELCRALRRHPAPHYVYSILLTARSSSRQIVEGFDAGADEFLVKPVSEGELLARMRASARIIELDRCLRSTARTDGLTGLPTQRTLFELLDREWCRAQRYKLPLSCVMMDLDYFKRINDVHGHMTGDAVLRAVGEVLREQSRASDIACRYGGDEFYILLPETSEHDAVLWADRVRRNVSSLTIPAGGQALQLTASFGVSQYYDDTQTAAKLLDQADQALLAAKEGGRDRVVQFSTLGDATEYDLSQARSPCALFEGIAARDVMVPALVRMCEDETVDQAAEFLLRTRVSSTPVVNAEGKLAGMLSEKDLMSAMFSLDFWHQPIRQFMKPNVICYEEDTPILKIYKFLCRVSIRRVVVVRDGRPTGTISRATLLRWFRTVVVSKGLLADPELSPTAEGQANGSRQRLEMLAREMAQHAEHLHQRIQDDQDDLMPIIVGGVSAIQEMLTDLLACSRYTDGTMSALAGAMGATSGSVLD